MKNKITDLNDHLFAELERLGDESLNGEDLEGDINRAKALSQVADRIIDNARLVLEATELKFEYGVGDNSMPEILGSNVRISTKKKA
jgi:hypothetical protein